jgi:predicted nucleic acid-binding protein
LARFLDSAVLVPVFVADHPHHQASIRLYSDCSRETDWCAAHSLAEVYSTLTRLPQPHRASPAQALACIENIVTRLRCVSLNGEEYRSVIEDAAGRLVGGATIYDALIAHCALKIAADSPGISATTSCSELRSSDG